MKRQHGKTLAIALSLAATLQGSAIAQAGPGDLITGTIDYMDSEVACEGYLAFDPALTGPRPGVLICHAWMGHDTYVRRRAEQLARLGYVAFALDIYGRGVRAKDGKEAGALVGSYKGDRPKLRQRALAGLATLRAQKQCDPDRIAVIGYCFGGTTALEIARSGADVRGIVSFHGGLATPMPAESGKVKAKVLACHGAADPHVPPAEVAAFQDEMDAAGVDWQMILYGGAVHSFTDRGAGDDPSRGAAYDASADARSWQAMLDFFAEIFHDAPAPLRPAGGGGEEEGPAAPPADEAPGDGMPGEETGAIDEPPFPPMPLPAGFFCPFEDERDAWTWINFDERAIITFGQICSYADPIELAVCQSGGKSHESIVETFGAAKSIHAAALLIGADRPRLPKVAGNEQAEHAIYDTAVIRVSWDRPGGEGRQTHRVEDLVLLATTGEPMPHVDWLFVGSYFASVPRDWRNKNDTFEVYAADYFDWGIVTTFNTPGSVFDNPLPEGQSDEWFISNGKLIPPAGTLVMVRIDFGETVERKLLLPPEEGHKPAGEDPEER